MKPEELRIGNYVYNNGVVVKCDGRTIFDLWSYSREDWCYILNGYKVSIDYKFGILGSSVILSKIKYVNQLQNLYFALTGDELILNKKA